MATDAFDLRLVAPFVALAEERDRARAALRCGLTADDLKDQVHQLERQAGAPLFEPGAAVELTATGQRVLAECSTLLDLAVQLGAAVTPVTGRLRVHLGFDSSPRVLALAESFAAAHPTTETVLVSGHDNDAERMLAAREVDVAIGIVGRDLPGGVRRRVIERSRWGVLCPAEHAVAAVGRTGWTSLEGRRLLFSPPGTYDGWSVGVRAALFRAGVRCVEVAGPGLSRPQDLGAVLRAHDALVVVPEGTAERAGPDGVVWAALEPAQFLERELTWRGEDPAVRLFVAWMVSGTADPDERAVGAAPS